jgi:uncharacterized protein (DUF362 family)/NAD-dependent dihydropyrimidine dehydrogenase PreA subunit
MLQCPSIQAMKEVGDMGDGPVAIVRCRDYDQARVDAAIQEAVGLLGGMERFVKPGQRVLLKVNLLRAADPSEGVVTHPSLVRALVPLVRQAGGHAVIGDSPGGAFSRSVLQRAYRKSGLLSVAEEMDVELNYNVGKSHLSFPEGGLLKALDVADFALNADMIISLPKLKTHAFMVLTGAIKVMFGIVPGLTKAGYHAKLYTKERFSEMLLDIHQFSSPVLSIMDGVVGMEGDGPSAGDLRHLDMIMASPSSTALDMAVAHMLGMDPEDVPVLAAAMRRGMVSGRLEDLQLLGADWKELRVADFRLPKGGREITNLPGFILRWMARELTVSPQANGQCVGCGVCVENCPVQAITIEDGMACMDWNDCIRCYCCHELCPEKAIDLRRSWLADVVLNRVAEVVRR